MRTLVTGGCGFIGQALVFDLANRHGNDSVAVFDALTAPATGEDRIRSLIGENLVVGNVLHKVSLASLIHKHRPDVVLHLAAQSHVDVSIKAASETWSINALGTAAVAETCARYKVPMVYCSTDEVYGSTECTIGARGDLQSLVRKNENAMLDPSNPYSASKAAGEMAVRAMGATQGLKWAITRGTNCFGPNQFPEKLIPIACKMLIEGKSVPLHGGGRQYRQWVHVSEFARALRTVAEGLVTETYLDVHGEVFNIAGTTICSVRDLVSGLAEVLDIAPEDAWHPVRDRPGQDFAYAINGRKMTDRFGFTATRAILDYEELKSLIDHYRDDRHRLSLAWCSDSM